MPLPVLRSHTPGFAPGPPVKTGARVRRFRGCKNRRRLLDGVQMAPARGTKKKGRLASISGQLVASSSRLHHSRYQQEACHREASHFP